MPMPPDEGSITRILGQVKGGVPAATQELFERSFRRLIGLARVRLRGLPLGAADEEDVALSAIGSFFGGVRHGRFPRLDDRNDLWRILLSITARKAIDLRVRETCAKRGGGGVLREADLRRANGPGVEGAGLERFIRREPTPADAAELADQIRRLLAILDDYCVAYQFQDRHELRRVALWKLEGYTDAEVATELGCCVRTVERSFKIIKLICREKMS